MFRRVQLDIFEAVLNHTTHVLLVLIVLQDREVSIDLFVAKFLQRLGTGLEFRHELGSGIGFPHFGEKPCKLFIKAVLFDILTVEHLESVVIEVCATANLLNHHQLALHLLDVSLLEVELDGLKAKFEQHVEEVHILHVVVGRDF